MAGGTTTLSYIIDGQNRRVGKLVNGTLTQGFLYDGQLQVVAQLDGNNNVVSRFVYGSRASVPDYMVQNGVEYRIIADNLGSPRLVVNGQTGAIVQEMDYDEFGNITSDTNPGFQPFGYAGGLYDRDLKLVRFGVRDYDPDGGRWISKDTIRFAAGDTNLYGYVLSDPINGIDPIGTQVEFMSLQPVGGPVLLGTPPWVAAASSLAIAAYLTYGFARNLQHCGGQGRYLNYIFSGTYYLPPSTQWGTPWFIPVGFSFDANNNVWQWIFDLNVAPPGSDSNSILNPNTTNPGNKTLTLPPGYFENGGA
jgi:RHS repeat-associated protein